MHTITAQLGYGPQTSLQTILGAQSTPFVSKTTPFVPKKEDVDGFREELVRALLI